MDTQQKNKPQDDELRDFMIVVRQALLMLVAYIEKRYVVKTKAR